MCKVNVPMTKMRKATLIFTLFTITMGCGSPDDTVSAKAPQPNQPLSLETPTPAGPAERDTDPRVVLKINGDPITMGEINTMAYAVLHQSGLSPYSPEGQKALLSIRPNILNTLLSLRLLKQGAKKLKVKMDPSLVEKHIEAVKSRYSSEKEFLRSLEKEGMTLEAYRNNVTDEIIVQTVKDRIMGEGVVEPTDEEVEEFYNAHLKDFKKPEMIHLCLLMIGYPENPAMEQKSEAFSIINRLYFRILAGENFEELATTYSTGPNKEKGGDLGYKPREYVQKYLENAPEYQLAAGNVTPVLETPTGYVLLYPKEIVPKKDVSLEQASQEIRGILKDRQKARNLQRWLNSQTESAKMEVVDPDLYKLVSVSQ